MMTRREILALSVMMEIARHTGAKHYLSAKDLGARHGLSARAFELLLKDLARARLLKGQRGPRGGYALAGSAADISLLSICSAARPAESRSFPLSGDRYGQLQPLLQRIERSYEAQLKVLTLADLLPGVRLLAA